LSFNTVDFMVFGVPPYIFFAGIGFVLGFLIINILALVRNIDIKKINLFFLLSLPMIIFGGKAMGIIYNLLECFKNDKPITKETFFRSGIVFYGGLILFVAWHLIMSRFFDKRSKKIYLDIVAISIPLFHACGRVGCFTAGCCYGVKYKSLFSVYYTFLTKDSLNSEWRVPIQLIEASANLILFIILIFLFKKRIKRGQLIAVYLFAYSFLRIIFEFFRGDRDINLLFGISFSQMISGMIILTLICYFILYKRRKPCSREENGDIFLEDLQ